jgi:D-alanyl-D-alanine carboxypeptidase/D-alanyl-D-alanine-endopeptidase (penicillin-binding protein 4)
MLMGMSNVNAQVNGEGETVTDSDSVAVLVTDTLPYPQNLVRRIDTLLNLKLFQRSQVGLMVYDLTDDSCIYRHNERQTMRPASTQKLVTAITAIDRLGGAHLFRTSLFYTGQIANRTLTGDLICVGGMDPAFTNDDMRAFVERLHSLGIDTIRGCILADNSFKDDDLLGEGWCWDDDNPTLSPLLINKKADFVERLAEALRNDGVSIMPQPTEGRGERNLVCTRTHTLDQILSRMMKESDNLYAESMFYQVGAATGAHPAKASHARQTIQQLIQKVGLLPADYKIADGSGLSLYNYVTPELHVRLLRYAWRNKNVLEHLLPSLPIAGVDGTLRNRMKGTAAAGNVRAKTGTVTCVSALAGYCTADNGHELCFAIMNQGVLRIADGRDFQDRVCRALCMPKGESLFVKTQSTTSMTKRVSQTAKSRNTVTAKKSKKTKKNKKKSKR